MISFALTVARKDLLLTFTRGSGLVQGLCWACCCCSCSACRRAWANA